MQISSGCKYIVVGAGFWGSSTHRTADIRGEDFNKMKWFEGAHDGKADSIPADYCDAWVDGSGSINWIRCLCIKSEIHA